MRTWILKGEAVAKYLPELVPMKQSGIGEDGLNKGLQPLVPKKDIPSPEYSRAGTKRKKVLVLRRDKSRLYIVREDISRLKYNRSATKRSSMRLIFCKAKQNSDTDRFWRTLSGLGG